MQAPPEHLPSLPYPCIALPAHDERHGGERRRGVCAVLWQGRAVLHGRERTRLAAPENGSWGRKSTLLPHSRCSRENETSNVPALLARRRDRWHPGRRNCFCVKAKVMEEEWEAKCGLIVGPGVPFYLQQISIRGCDGHDMPTTQIMRLKIKIGKKKKRIYRGYVFTCKTKNRVE